MIETERGIDVSGTASPVPPATFKLLNTGKARATGVVPFIEFSDTEAMKVTIEHVEEKTPHDLDTPFVHASEQMVPKFALKGSGSVLLAFGFKFRDVIGNEYATEMIKIPVTKPKKKRVEVPIESILSDPPAMALVSTGY